MFGGYLQPMNVLGTFGTTNNAVTSLNDYWYSVSGSGDCNTISFLEYGGEYHGFQYIPPNPSFGSINLINVFASVDLPEPLSPTIETSSPLPMVKLLDLIIFELSKYLSIFFISK